MLMSPLHQRLFLYRFALVELDPHLSLIPEDWKRPHLQYLLPSSVNRRYWEHLLGHCAPFRTLSDAAVISPSLPALLKLRAQQPDRPLILCRTAYESGSDQRAVALARPSHPVTTLLQGQDPWRPIRWIAAREGTKMPTVDAYHPPRDHPLSLLRRALLQHDPNALLTIREDGRFQVQRHLFQRPSQPFLKPARWDTLADLHDRTFREQMEQLRGIHYVFAAQKERLAWFRRDCLRLLPARFYCWHYPEAPDPRDPLSHFVLARDADIRFARLPPNVGVLALDGSPTTHAYRLARYPVYGFPHWAVGELPEAMARLFIEDRELMFHRDGRGWFCYSARTDVPDQSDVFIQRLAALNLVLRPKRIRPKLWRRGGVHGKLTPSETS